MRERFESRRVTVLLLVLVMAIAAPRARAQSTATIQGTVTDAQNAVMPGVSITVRHGTTSQERSVVTDAAGQFVAPALAPGTYEVTAHLEGFQDQKREVPLGPAQTVALNLKMSRWSTPARSASTSARRRTRSRCLKSASPDRVWTSAARRVSRAGVK
jgi:Carboxypeptidase regulatory-like domain